MALLLNMLVSTFLYFIFFFFLLFSIFSHVCLSVCVVGLEGGEKHKLQHVNIFLPGSSAWQLCIYCYHHQNYCVQICYLQLIQQ